MMCFSLEDPFKFLKVWGGGGGQGIGDRGSPVKRNYDNELQSNGIKPVFCKLICNLLVNSWNKKEKLGS